MQNFTQLPLTKGVRRRNLVTPRLKISEEAPVVKEKEVTSESLRLDLNRMETKLDTKLDILIQMVSRLGQVSADLVAQNVPSGASASEISYLRSLTPRQHIVAQCLTQGLLNRDISEIMGVGENTIKVHVRAVCKKADVKTRGQAAMIYQDICSKLDADEYHLLSQGIPIDWCITYDPNEDDPYWHLYQPYRDRGQT